MAKTVDLYVIDDRKNSANFVHYCMDLYKASFQVYGCMELYKASFQVGGYLNHGDKHFLFSGGSLTPLNMVGNFLYVARYSVNEGVRMICNILQSCHSKGEWDGEVAIQKDGIRQSIKIQAIISHCW